MWQTVQAGLFMVGLFVSANAAVSCVRAEDFSMSKPKKW